jgi:hypothetical protein
MSHVKTHMTEFIPVHHPKFTLKGVHADWEMHPSYINAVEALDTYNVWVSEVLMTVAFQWIEEHHDEVYAKVAEEHKGDVGVVVSTAFEMIKELSSYRKWMAASQRYEAALADGTWDTSKINPTWTRIVQDVRAATEVSFAAEAERVKEASPELTLA